MKFCIESSSVFISFPQGAFLVPAPPLSTRRPSDTESFVMTPKLATAIVPNASTATGSQQQQQQLEQLSNQPHLVRQGHNQQQQQQITTQTIHIPGAGFSAQGNGKSIILSGDSKDATLIELLKRGTKVAIKRTISEGGSSRQEKFLTISIPKCIVPFKNGMDN